MVAQRRHLPDLSALVPGLRRRRGRRPARDRARGSTTSSGSASTRCGCRRSTRRRWRTWATTCPTTRASTRSTARSSDFDALVAAAHERGLKLLMDLVPCHTSIEHPWFREHPDWYIWSDATGRQQLASRRSAAPPGRATRSGRGWYLHSFYPEQPDLDWRNPEVVAAMQGVLRFWLERGVDGFRLDAIDRLLKDPELRDDPPATEPFGAAAERGVRPGSTHVHSGNAPDIGAALGRDPRGRRRRAAWWARSTCRAARWRPYLEHLDPAFAFELLHSPWEAERAARAIAGQHARSPARRLGACRTTTSAGSPRASATENARAAAMLLLTLPGPAFLYQGDEIGQAEGPGAEPRFDRAGRDRAPPPDAVGRARRRAASPPATPWLPLVDPARAQRRSPARRPGLACCRSYRELIALRPRAGRRFELLDAAAGRRGLPARRPHASRSTPRPSRARRRRAPATGALVQPRAPTPLTRVRARARMQAPSQRWIKATALGGRSSRRRREDLHGRHLLAALATLSSVGCWRRAAAARAAAAARHQLVRVQRAGRLLRQGRRRLQQAGRRQVPHQLRQAADRRQPAARADRPPPGRQGQRHRPDRHGRDLDRRAGRGRLDPAVGGRSRKAAAEKDKLQGPLKTVEYKGKVWAIPFTSNTQLLWYRKDKVDKPPADFTWDEMIDDAVSKGSGTSRSRRASTRASTVWINSLIAGAGGQIVDQAGDVKVDDTREDGRRDHQQAGQVEGRAARACPPTPRTRRARASSRAAPTTRSTTRSSIRARPRCGKDFQKNMGWARYPRTEKDKPSRPPLGGINIGVSNYSKTPRPGLRGGRVHRPARAPGDRRREGRPAADAPSRSTTPRRSRRPTRSRPAAPVDRGGGAAPRTPAYSDISLAIQKTFSPPDGIDPNGIVQQAA